jgi:S1-C subfamily serine protease
MWIASWLMLLAMTVLGPYLEPRMRDSLRTLAAKRWQAPMCAVGLSLLATAPATAQTTSLEDLVSAVVAIKTFINPDARTTETLGREREGSGIVIDEDGLVLTIGYLMVEAHAAQVTTNAGRAVPANVVGYDHETGFGLLRTIEPLKLKPLGFGKSGAVREGDPALVASFGGPQMVAPVRVVSKRAFAGSWEYLLDQALYTAPPHPIWSGAALISREGKLIGVGSLIVGDATGGTEKQPGNMFVPIDLLPPILADLIADGRASGPAKPWLGVNADDSSGRLLISRVTAGGPAERAGIARGDVIVGVNGEPAKTMAEFYRKVWALGTAGTTIPLDIEQSGSKRRLEIKSMNRLDHLKLKSTF